MKAKPKLYAIDVMLPAPTEAWEHMELRLTKLWLRNVDLNFRLHGHRKARMRKKAEAADRAFSRYCDKYIAKGGIPF